LSRIYRVTDITVFNRVMMPGIIDTSYLGYLCGEYDLLRQMYQSVKHFDL